MPLNVIGLISGGKDSFYSLAHCVENGHTVVALANLCPRGDRSNNDQDESPDINSFMYQTVGHSVIPIYAQALDLPLYRQPITGTAVQSGRYYAVQEVANNTTPPTMTPDDETEDMYLLLAEILRHHPEANAVSAGAILSTYQRTRVESVIVRLGLTPLAYLWQYPALPPPPSREDSITGLLDDMYSAGCDARLLKIASAGIRSNLLFTNVAGEDTRTRLVSGLAVFHTGPEEEYVLRGAVLGEGGEYETLALDGPASLWKKKILIDSVESFDGESGTIYAKLGKAVLVNKDEGAFTKIPIPALFDKRFNAVRDHFGQFQPSILFRNYADTLTFDFNFNFKTSVTQTYTIIQVSNLNSYDSSQQLSPTTQLTNIIASLPIILSNLPQSPTLESISSTTLLLSSMSNFGSLNKVYSQHLWRIGLPNPPARVTVAAPLPPCIDVSLSLTITLPPLTDHLTILEPGRGQDIKHSHQLERKGLHVQSLSYWAPANIGPYSQAIHSPISIYSPRSSSNSQRSELLNTPVEVIHMAGQIPLTPSSMQLLQASFAEQATLALQHLWRVGQERAVDIWAGACVAYLAKADGDTDRDGDKLTKVHEAARTWRLAHQIDERGRHFNSLQNDSTQSEEDEDEDFDVWNHQQNRGFGVSNKSKIAVGEHLHVLPNYTAISITDGELLRLGDIGLSISSVENIKRPIPTFIAAEVTDLPRYATIEWWSTGIAGLVSHAGRENARTFGIKKEEIGLWTLEGIIIEHRGLDHEGDIDDLDTLEGLGTDRSAQHDTNGFSVFLTLCIDSKSLLPMSNSGISEQYFPRTVSDLQKILFSAEATKPSDWEFSLVTAHSFVNLAGTSNARATLEETQLVQDSTIVPCYHLWTSTKESYDPTDPNTAGTEAVGQESIRELAAAIVLRIDVCHASAIR